jgi:lipopolysaccharide/colanic/teichoic acid biosynthesis glycosyltransferase
MELDPPQPPLRHPHSLPRRREDRAAPRWSAGLTPFDGSAGARGPAGPSGGSFDAPLGKSLLDRTGAAVLLLMVLPVLLGVAALLWGFRPGPVLVRRRCAGPRGRTFELLRFRDAVDGDPPFMDRLLHDRGLAQLPQLLNVLRGDMSLVGPRPQPAGALRVELRPGLTGLPAAEATSYARSWSFGRDLAILRAALVARRMRS